MGQALKMREHQRINMLETESVCDFLGYKRDKGSNLSQPPTKGLNINSTLDGFLTSGFPVALRQTTRTVQQKGPLISKSHPPEVQQGYELRRRRGVFCFILAL